MITLKFRKKLDKQYYFTEIDKEHFDKIIDYNKRNKLQQLNGLLGLECQNIIKIGAINSIKPSAITNYVGLLLGRNTGDGREIHYRDYSKTEEQQRDSMHLINICPDSRLSAVSALKTFTKEYGILWFKKIE